MLVAMKVGAKAFCTSLRQCIFSDFFISVIVYCKWTCYRGQIRRDPAFNLQTSTGKLSSSISELKNILYPVCFKQSELSRKYYPSVCVRYSSLFSVVFRAKLVPITSTRIFRSANSLDALN